ncbi:hypothetical protein L195_g023067 [Trifolium pratense]|uniref:Uncharacterized protein n=1 Tax=Trifolium pratense TaxID=57577 RepID=A0A2K3KZF2_TRIPR|nr:hypothetical protein L195_g027555 [Trifolium pratense]PNX99797.1 hypothetical protein L195_g023067 [Trifolium pratense]
MSSYWRQRGISPVFVSSVTVVSMVSFPQFAGDLALLDEWLAISSSVWFAYIDWQRSVLIQDHRYFPGTAVSENFFDGLLRSVGLNGQMLVSFGSSGRSVFVLVGLACVLGLALAQCGDLISK